MRLFLFDDDERSYCFGRELGFYFQTDQITIPTPFRLTGQLLSKKFRDDMPGMLQSHLDELACVCPTQVHHTHRLSALVRE